MGLLARLFSGRGVSLAQEAAEKVTPPDIEDSLRQHHGDHDYPPYIRHVIGSFKPRAVDMATRIQMRNAPDVAFMTALIRAPIVNMRWTIESKDPELAAAVDALLRPEYVSLAKGASLAMPYGYQVVQPVFEAKPFGFEVEDKSQGTSTAKTLPMAWVPKRYKAIDPRTLTLKADEKTDEFLGVSQDILAGKTVAAAAESLILWSFRAEDVWGRLDGYGIYDDAYTPWYDQAAITLMRNRYFERRADPTPIGYAESAGLKDQNGKDVDGYGLMRSQLGAWKNGSFIVLPGRRDEKGNRVFGVELLTDDKRGDMYQAAIDAEGTQILKCGLVPGEAATSEPMGSRARAEVHENRLGEIQQTHVDEWRRVFQGFARRVATYNFGAERVEKFGLTVKAAGISPSMRDLYKEVLQKVMDAEGTLDAGGAVPLRKRIDAVAMCDDLELPMRPLEDAQKEFDAELEAREERAEAEAARMKDMKLTPEDEEAVRKDLARQGLKDEE